MLAINPESLPRSILTFVSVAFGAAVIETASTPIFCNSLRLVEAKFAVVASLM